LEKCRFQNNADDVATNGNYNPNRGVVFAKQLTNFLRLLLRSRRLSLRYIFGAMTFSITTLSVIALDTAKLNDIFAECRLC
jgi:hypothetical protein